MPTDVAHERYLELSARITAFEYLVKQLLWMQAENHVREHGGDATEPISALRQDAAASLQRATFPSLDPASSDHVSALTTEHVDRVLGELIEEIQEASGTQRT
jgi:hypothetical protein